LLLIFVEHRLGGGKGIYDDVGRFEFKLLDATDRILNPGANAVNNMEIGFQFLSKETHRVQYSILTIDVVVLDDCMKDTIFHR
jgi:hypothetical protein